MAFFIASLGRVTVSLRRSTVNINASFRLYVKIRRVCLTLYPMVTAEQIKSLGERLERLETYLNLEQKRIHIINEEEKTASPEFWDDPKQG